MYVLLGFIIYLLSQENEDFLVYDIHVASVFSLQLHMVCIFGIGIHVYDLRVVHLCVNN